jgi:outer membrane biosynthesis protein TonB
MRNCVLKFPEDFMTKRVQSFWLLSALVVFLSVGISLNAQQTTPQTAAPDPQAQQPTATQPTAPAETDQTQTPAQAPSSQTPDEAQPTQTPSQPPAQTPDRATPPASMSESQAQSAEPTGAQSFSGTIVKSGDKYMLKDEASGQTYDIDHQDEVQKYEGKRVKVHGTLDASGKMIHLQ